MQVKVKILQSLIEFLLVTLFQVSLIRFPLPQINQHMQHDLYEFLQMMCR